MMLKKDLSPKRGYQKIPKRLNYLKKRIPGYSLTFSKAKNDSQAAHADGDGDFVYLSNTDYLSTPSYIIFKQQHFLHATTIGSQSKISLHINLLTSCAQKI